jgi:U32 family peptidase
MAHTVRKKVELLAPAGSFEKLEIAIHYGADAVYLAGKNFSLRNFSGNFTIEELDAAVQLAHAHHVKVYVACNIFSRNHDQDMLSKYLHQLEDIAPDALIISDPGILLAAKTAAPHLPIHLSTQANTTNYQSALFWENLGIQRINVARELSLSEIKEISNRCHLEIEAFVHGAMCMSYSGRCLLSNVMTNRDSNRGMCSHPCRWRYAVVEEQRPGIYYPIAEDQNNSYIFNSSDLCMIEYLPKMVDSGIHSLKIEGRMKGIHYVAVVVKVYREAIDAYYQNPEGYSFQENWRKELKSVSHRSYGTGFYFGDLDAMSANIENTTPTTIQLFLGKILASCGHQTVRVNVRNKLFQGETVEVVRKKGAPVLDRIETVINEQGESVPFAQPNEQVTVSLTGSYEKNDLIRRLPQSDTEKPV